MVFLMYHELELPGRNLCRREAGYMRYVLAAADFRAQMQSLGTAGWKGLSVSQSLVFPEYPAVTITFDDGCETDLVVAAPILRSLNFNATFYITYEFLETSGYLTRKQLLKLSDLGFEIGCHSMSHAYLSDLDDGGLQREIAESKVYLEHVLCKPVDHFSCPGGRFDRRVEEVAKAAGYHSVATSRLHRNSSSTNPYALGRVAMMRGTPLREFESLCQGHGLWQMSLRSGIQQGAKHLLGNSLYDRVRSAVLK
ncbi:MAG TPA: polysaccharide deacetylase family protein [Terriglobales bacterium]|jgi:peptidoglycan/xylan/chitin deacetylase (PgdA/CDA1 family)|nr:polysaccharide deacetylase family protein [Terriglobales bacterium]